MNWRKRVDCCFSRVPFVVNWHSRLHYKSIFDLFQFSYITILTEILFYIAIIHLFNNFKWINLYLRWGPRHNGNASISRMYISVSIYYHTPNNYLAMNRIDDTYKGNHSLMPDFVPISFCRFHINLSYLTSSFSVNLAAFVRVWTAKLGKIQTHYNLQVKFDGKNAKSVPAKS